MKWLLQSDYTYHLDAKESMFSMDAKSCLSCLWEEKKARFLCSASRVKSMKAFYNGKKCERHKTRVTGRKEGRGRQAGKKKKINLNFQYQHCCVFQKWTWKTHSGWRNHFYTPRPILRLIFLWHSGKVSARVTMKWSPLQEESARGLYRRRKTKWWTRTESAATWESTQEDPQFIPGGNSSDISYN